MLTAGRGSGRNWRSGPPARCALLRPAVQAALTAVDLTEIVLAHVDLDAVAAGIDVDAVTARADVDAVVARTDLDAVVSRLDQVRIAREVIAEIDLAEISRGSTGVVSSQAARAVRTEGMNAHESVARVVDRLLRRPHPHGAVS